MLRFFPRQCSPFLRRASVQQSLRVKPCLEFSCNVGLQRTFSTTHGPDTDKEDKAWISKENRTLPNLITFLRILASPGLTFAIANDMKGLALAGCAVFSFSDWLDGYIARKYNQKSTLGSFLDPAADKVMVGALSFGLMQKELLPTELVALVIGRDVFLLTMSFLIRAIEKPPGAAFFEVNKKTTTFEIVPSEISKINTGIQFSLLTLTLGNFAFGFPSVEVLEPMWWITATTTIMSGVGYLDGSGVKFLDLKKKLTDKMKR